MQWRCPACQTPVRHDPISGPPRVGDPYRCHVCRLDLQFDADTNDMVIAPLEPDHVVSGKTPTSTFIVPPAKRPKA